MHPASNNSSYETPDADSVRGLMVGLQDKTGTYEQPDSGCVSDFISNITQGASDDSDDYEEPLEGMVELPPYISKRTLIRGNFVPEVFINGIHLRQKLSC